MRLYNRYSNYASDKRISWRVNGQQWNLFKRFRANYYKNCKGLGADLMLLWNTYEYAPPWISNNKESAWKLEWKRYTGGKVWLTEYVCISYSQDSEWEWAVEDPMAQNILQWCSFMESLVRLQQYQHAFTSTLFPNQSLGIKFLFFFTLKRHY